MPAEYYTQSLQFSSSFREQISPAYMAFVGADQGYVVPSIESAFGYCELGCGDGTTLNLLAALFPRAEFVGVDFNEAHIAAARQESSQAALANVRYVHSSFSQLAGADLPQFDFIACAGTYGWLEPELQADVRAFVGAHCKLGGLFAVEYLPVPGKSAIEPVWRSLQKMFPLVDYGGSERERGEAVMAFVRKLVHTNAPLFQGHPSVKNVLEGFVQRIDKNPAKVQDFIHNSLASGFRTRYFDEVSGEFAEQGLQFLGQLRNHSQDSGVRQLYPRLGDMIATLEQPGTRELAKDLLFNNTVRLDLYGRNSEKCSETANRYLAETFTLRFKAPPREGIPQRLADLFKDDLDTLAGHTDEQGFLAFSEVTADRGEVQGLIRWLHESGSLVIGLAAARGLRPSCDLSTAQPRPKLMSSRLRKSVEALRGVVLMVPEYVSPIAEYDAVECVVLSMQLELGFATCEQLLRDYLAGEGELVDPYKDSALSDHSRVQLRKMLKPILESGKQQFYTDWGFLGAAWGPGNFPAGSIQG